MQKRILFLTLLAVLITSAMIRGGVTAEVATTSVSPLATIKSPGEIFFVTLNVTNVQKLWGYQYKLLYNTTVLTALNFTNMADLLYSEFTLEEASGINDTRGSVSASYHAPLGDHTGLTTVESKPLLQIAFQVDAEGSSTIDIDNSGTRLVDIYGDAMIPSYNLWVSDGYFSTQAIQLHNIAITGVTVSSTSATIGDTISIDVSFRNDGDFTENFTITVKYNITEGTGFKDIQEEAVTNLAPDDSSTLSFSWVTSGVVAGKHIVRAEATVASEAYPTDNTFDSNVITFTGAGQMPPYHLYAAIGIVIVIVIVVVIFVLRRH